MQIGDRKTCLCYFGNEIVGKKLTGTVTYIHPERRFYVVRFDFPQGRSFSETFYFPSRAGNPAAADRDPSDHEGNHSRIIKPIKEVWKRSFL